MKKTISIEGMMCTHCEATVKKALEALPEVTEAEVSHTAGTAVVTLSAPVDDAALKAAKQEDGCSAGEEAGVHQIMLPQSLVQGDIDHPMVTPTALPNSTPPARL